MTPVLVRAVAPVVGAERPGSEVDGAVAGAVAQAAAVVGWAGAVLLLTAYLLVSSGRLDGDGAAYQGLNVLGSLGLGAAAACGGVWSSVALNGIWAGVGVGALVRVLPGWYPRSRDAAPHGADRIVLPGRRERPDRRCGACQDRTGGP